MRFCRVCKEFLPLREFSFCNEGRRRFQSHCKSCQRAYCKEHYRRNSAIHNERRRVNQKRYSAENRGRLLEYLQSHECVDCGEKDPVVLEFDHVRGVKSGNIGNMLSTRSWLKIAQELEKCVVRCANCHRRKTAKQFKWFKSFGM